MYIAKGDSVEPLLFEPRIVPYLPPPGWFSPSGMSGDQRTVIKGNPSQYVKLNVGGCLYYTTIGTLTKAPDTMLQAMFSGRMEVLTDPEGWILIDRCGKHFGTVLNYLRDGNVGLPTNSQELEEILAEAKFYCIAGLINQCEKALENRNTVLSPVCQVPFITSEDERKQFIANAAKPVVELLINRHNNKYSYTNTSDENLLKNLEMFDRLALRFNGRIHFIKDAIGPSEICCWRFYGNGKKFAEVCCTSIVYATDRKHTKVEFPEARIYEETLNSFLYENRPGPDQELMRATSVGGVFGVGGVGVTSCTSDEEEDRRNHHRSSNMTKRKIKKSVRFSDGNTVLNIQRIISRSQAAGLDSKARCPVQVRGYERWNNLVRELDKIFRSGVQNRKTSSFKTSVLDLKTRSKVQVRGYETWDYLVTELNKLFPPSSRKSSSEKKEEKEAKPMSTHLKWLREHCDLKFLD